MKANQLNLLTVNISKKDKKDDLNEQEGSLHTIEKPQDKNVCPLIETEAEIKKKRLAESIPKPTKATASKTPAGFISHVQQNRKKYNY